MLEQHRHSLTDSWTRPDTKELHYPMTIDRGLHGMQFLLLPELCDPLFELVYSIGNRPRSLLITGGHIAADQCVETVEKRTGVADVPADGPVRPSHLERVRPHVEVHELHDVVRLIIGKPQCLHPGPRHSSADHLVVIQDMVDAVREDREVVIPVPAVRPTVELVLAMYQSAARNAPVALPIQDDPSVWEM